MIKREKGQELASLLKEFYSFFKNKINKAHNNSNTQ